MYKYHIIYEITNLINNKKYRGAHATNNLNDNYMGSGILIRSAIKKHGISNFKKEILQHCISAEEMFKIEKIYVDENWINNENTYNLKIGGVPTWNIEKKGVQIPWNKGIQQGPMSEEGKNNISKGLKKKYETQPHPTKGIRYKRKNKSVIPPWNKNKKMVKTACPHCGTLADKSNLKHWHLDNCKQKKTT